MSREPKGTDVDDISRHLGDLAEQEMRKRQIWDANTTTRQPTSFLDENVSNKHLQ